MSIRYSSICYLQPFAVYCFIGLLILFTNIFLGHFGTIITSHALLATWGIPLDVEVHVLQTVLFKLIVMSHRSCWWNDCWTETSVFTLKTNGQIKQGKYEKCWPETGVFSEGRWASKSGKICYGHHPDLSVCLLNLKGCWKAEDLFPTGSLGQFDSP